MLRRNRQTDAQRAERQRQTDRQAETQRDKDRQTYRQADRDGYR